MTVDVLALVKHWMLEPTNTWPPMEMLEFARIRCVVFKELCRNIVLAVVNVPATFKLLWTFTGPTMVAEDRTEVPSATNRLLRFTRFDELYRVFVTKVDRGLPNVLTKRGPKAAVVALRLFVMEELVEMVFAI